MSKLLSTLAIKMEQTLTKIKVKTIDPDVFDLVQAHMKCKISIIMHNVAIAVLVQMALIGCLQLVGVVEYTD